MTHRELILTCRKKAKFEFLALPEELQDRIVEGLDLQELTLEEAARVVSETGFKLSHAAIARYYAVVRRERRIHDSSQELSRIVSEFADRPFEEALSGLTHLIIATTAKEIAEGNVGIKDIDIAKVIKAMSELKKATPVEEPKPEGTAAEKPRGLTGEEVLREIREVIYGLPS